MTGPGRIGRVEAVLGWGAPTRGADACPDPSGVDALPAMVWLADRGGRLLDVNAAWRWFTGGEDEERWDSGIHPEDVARCQETYARAAAAGEPFRLQYRRLHADRRFRWVLDVASPTRKTAAEPPGLTGCCLEIDDLKQVELGLQDANAVLRGANDGLEEVAHAANHDLGGTLSIVAIYMGLLQRRYAGQLDAEAGECIRNCVDAGAMMRRLLQDLVAYLRLVHVVEPATQRVDCDAVFRRAVQELQAPMQESGGVIVACGPLPAVRAEERHVFELLKHLLDNALKFRGEEPPRVEVSAERRGQDWVVSVRDNGIGIDPALAPQVFGIFKRLHGYKYPGTGMGLAICTRIVERYGGRIWLESAAGQGATFSFSLPAWEEEA